MHQIGISPKTPNCPSCNQIETSIHILRDCPWENQVWNQLPGLLPLNFFQDPFQIWLSNNSTSKNLVNEQYLPSHLLLVMSLWQTWLARNEKSSSITQSQLIHKSMHLAFEFYCTAYPTTSVSNKITKTIKWNPLIDPFVSLNIDGSSFGNPGRVGAWRWGFIRSHTH